MFFTYIHRKVTDNSVFYVGCGSKQRITDIRKNKRSEDWHKTASKCGWYAETVAQWNDRVDALSHEQLLISCFKDMGHLLVNKPLGLKKGYKLGPMLATHKEKLSKSLVGRFVSKETRQKMSVSGKGKLKPKSKYMCLECGKITGNQWLLTHQAKSNHVGKVQL